MNRRVLIKEIAMLNANSFKKNDFPPLIYYLDTGNLTKNSIDELQQLNVLSDKIPSRARRKVKRHTILYSTVRPNQEHYGFIEDDYESLVVSTGFTTIDIIDSKISPKYIYYALTQKHITEYLHTIGTNSVSAYPSISSEDIGSLELLVPESKIKQEKIAYFLSTIDAKININNKINAELESMAKLIYDYWFVQFDFPDENGKPYRSSGGKMVYNEELKREIPEHWNVKALHNFASTASGGTPLKSKKEYYENGKIVWINSGEVNQPFIIRGSKYITEMGLKNSSAKVFERGTILMAMYGATAGKVSLMDLKAATNQAICGINPINSYYTYFTKYALQDLYEHLVTLSSGSARDNLSQEKIRNLKFPFPKDQILISYHKRMKPIFDLILNNLKENDQLIEVRDWLLPMLMNGQVTIKD